MDDINEASVHYSDLKIKEDRLWGYVGGMYDSYDPIDDLEDIDQELFSLKKMIYILEKWRKKLLNGC